MTYLYSILHLSSLEGWLRKPFGRMVPEPDIVANIFIVLGILSSEYADTRLVSNRGRFESRNPALVLGMPNIKFKSAPPLW
jgi:hypothetical protein